MLDIYEFSILDTNNDLCKAYWTAYPVRHPVTVAGKGFERVGG